MTSEPTAFLMAEDDLQDRLLVRKAFESARAAHHLSFVADGEELLRYLRRQAPFSNVRRPDLILLDLNMPRMDGREALREIRRDPQLRVLPVVVLTTSAAEEDILHSYDLGANSYIRKPATFREMVEVVEAIGLYWLGIVKLPPCAT